MSRFFITMGSDEGFPYPNKYLIVHAENKEEAHNLFRLFFSDRHEGVANYSFLYSEKAWKETGMEKSMVCAGTLLVSSNGYAIADVNGSLLIKPLKEKVEEIIQALDSKTLFTMMTPQQQEDIYRAVWKEHVEEDVKSLMGDKRRLEKHLTPEGVSEVVDRYIYDGDYDCNKDYWSNLENLINDVYKKEQTELRERLETTIQIVAIVGKTATGKDTVAGYLNAVYDIPPIISFTTRPKREGEEDGREHNFISKEEMDALVSQPDQLLAYTKFLKTGYEYCASTKYLIPGVFSYIIDPPGLEWLKAHRPDILVHVIAMDAPEETIRAHAKNRGDDPQTVEDRLDSEREIFERFFVTVPSTQVISSDQTKWQMLTAVDKLIENWGLFIND